MLKRYAVVQRQPDESARRIGTVLANNYTHASVKAHQLFRTRHIWVERLS